jgi:CRISPR-associated protein Cas1
MAMLYVTEQGSRIVREGYALAVWKGQERLFLQPMATLEGLVLFGRVELSNAVVGILGRYGIPCAFVSSDGRFKAALVGEPGKNVLLRQRQYELASDPRFRLDFARRLVTAKVQNTVRLLQKRGFDAQGVLGERLHNLKRSIRGVQNLDQIRGLEGSFAALYFSHFATLLKNPMGFARREKHPPKDPINILLSLGYTLLFNTVFAFVCGRGLDPHRGFYHDLSYGHPALVSDLTEEFRAPIVDGLVLTLVNREQIRPEHFAKEEGRMRLSRDALRTFVTAFEARLNTVVQTGSGRMPFRRIIQEQVQEFCRSLARRGEYRPFIYR